MDLNLTISFEEVKKMLKNHVINSCDVDSESVDVSFVIKRRSAKQATQTVDFVVTGVFNEVTNELVDKEDYVVDERMDLVKEVEDLSRTYDEVVTPFGDIEE